MKYSNEKTLYHGAGGKLFEFGRDLRQRSTEAEKVLWGYLRNRKFYGLKFRRQHPIDEFVADFYCHEKKLIIELDGSIHEIEQNAQYDKARTNDLSERNSRYQVYQFRGYTQNLICIRRIKKIPANRLTGKK